LANVGNVLDFSYGFKLGTIDNGNVASIANNRDTTRSQSFTYDQLNHIATAKTTSTSGASCWDESFGLDVWGNLLSIARITGYSCSNEENLSVGATTKNQLSTTGYVYDAAGNLITVPAPGGASYTYNAENQLTATAGVTYSYDGGGKRVKKSNGKLYWYGMGSDPLDESDLSGNMTSEFVFFGVKRIAKVQLPAGTVNYYFADHLGTSRIVTNSSGGVLDDSDFYPFGGERVILSSSGNSYKFTSKERDSESGADNFGARYYSSSMARFTAIDPIVISKERKLDPQQLNAYSYARGNPLRFVDPDGQEIRLEDLSDLNRDRLLAELQKQTGLRLQYNAKTGNLDVVGDPSKASTGSAIERQGLLAAINSKDVFNVVDRTEYKGEAVAVGAYDPKTKTVVLNFSNIARVEEKHPNDVNLGTTFYHELVGHGVEGLPDTRLLLFWKPTALDRENQVREQLGMYIRTSWQPTKCENGTCTISLHKNLDNGITDTHFVDIPVSKKP
jgi:RHS repeat-associated protein